MKPSRFPAMRRGRIFPGAICFLLGIATLGAQGIDVIWQHQTVVSTTEISPAPYRPWNRNSIEKEGVGDQMLSTAADSSFQGMSVQAESALMFRRTDTAGEILFSMESGAGMHSEGVLTGADGEFTLTASTMSRLAFEFRSQHALRYEIDLAVPESFGPPNAGTIRIGSSGFEPIALLALSSSQRGPLRSVGNLPAGTYHVEFSSSADGTGTAGPQLAMPISRLPGLAATLRIIVDESAPDPAPRLAIRAISGGGILIECTDMVSGLWYSLERSMSMDTGFWHQVAAFSAAGPVAVWSDFPADSSTHSFYRLRH